MAVSLDWYSITLSVGGYVIGVVTMAFAFGRYLAGVSRLYPRPRATFREMACDALGKLDPPQTASTLTRGRS